MSRLTIEPVVALTLIFAATGFADRAAAEGGCAIAGPPDARVTIEEFADFECPYCARGANTTRQILKDFPDQVKLVYRNLPLEMHANAAVAAKAFSAICMQSPSLAATFQQRVFNHQDRLKKDGEKFLYGVADKIGVDVNQMKTDMNGPEVARILAEDRKAFEAHGFAGTPSFVVGTEPVTGARSYAEFKKIVERQLGR